MNTSSATQVRRLNDPQILLRFFLSKHFKVCLEFSSLIRQNIGIWYNVVDSTPTMFLLHLHDVVA